MKLSALSLAAALFAATAASTAAHAALVTETYDFTLGGFVDPYHGLAPPISSVDASFTLTFDPTLSYSNDTVDIIENSLNVQVDTPIAFSYTPGQSGAADFLSIGGTSFDAGRVGGDNNDFVLQLEFANNASLNSPTLPLCSDPGFTCGPAPTDSYASGYVTTAAPGSLFVATTASVSAAPEPATWAMMLAGVSMVGVFLRFSRGRKPASSLA